MKETLLVDMDGVLADFDGGFLKIWRQKYPSLHWVPIEERRTFYLADQYPEELRDLIKEIEVSRGFYGGLLPIRGALEAVLQLNNHYDVFICTSPHTEYKNCVAEKFDWVKAYLGKEWIRKIVLTKDKTLVRGKYLIDDKPEIKGSQTPVWKQILYDQPYNRYRKDMRRMTWNNWEEILLKK